MTRNTTKERIPSIAYALYLHCIKHWVREREVVERMVKGTRGSKSPKEIRRRSRGGVVRRVREKSGIVKGWDGRK